MSADNDSSVFSSFPIKDIDKFKLQVISWVSQFNIFCCLDSNNYTNDRYTSYECIIGADAKEQITPKVENSFDALKQFHDEYKDWILGFLTYDLKNEVEKLTSSNFDGIQMEGFHFFIPRYLFLIHKNRVQIKAPGNEANKVFEKINNIPISTKNLSANSQFEQRVPKSEYLAHIDEIKNHIFNGNVYELNYCQEFYMENHCFDPIAAFNKLNNISKNPFSCFYKLRDKYLLCASPERFMKKIGDKLISQPIKGTIEQSRDPEIDLELKKKLRNDPKELAENVMIVDLVRNDLTKSSDPASVKVEELYGIYSFQHLHQMISTVSSEIKNDIHFVDAIKNGFPMGSMTGAPKIIAMELIEQYESTKRGVFSGSVGYIDPHGDFDFNVVIRSMLYNEPEKYLSFQVGSAITYDAHPENEYNECFLKAKPLMKVFR